MGSKREPPSGTKQRTVVAFPSAQQGEPYEQLAAAIATPIYNRVLKREVGHGDTDYEVYLQTEQLLSAQTPANDLVHHDEMMFQLVHQAQELWLKLLGHEATMVVKHLDGDDFWDAAATLERMTRIMAQLDAELEIIDTITPSSFLVIRRHLGDGSGQQSPGWNQLHMAARYLEGALTRALLRRGYLLLDVYRRDDIAPELLRVCELLTDLDANHQKWMVHHFLLVRRTIGIGRTVKALDGFPTNALGPRMTRPLFPALWEVRVQLTGTWDREGGTEPGSRQGSA
ncbi:MAG: tryptophan 2,3-dioxygenase family protein [Myxococcota bacterium]